MASFSRHKLASLSFIGLAFLTPLPKEYVASLNALNNLIWQKPLASDAMDMTKRYPDKWVNEVFSDNIVLALRYLEKNLPQQCTTDKNKCSENNILGEETSENSDIKISRQLSDADWEAIRKPFEFSFELKPGEVFAFHDTVLPEFKDKVIKTIGSKFSWDEGYKSDGYLIGDGVCHLASLMNWAAQDAGLKVTALVNHDFMPITGIPREYGTAIFYGNPQQNLYIENQFEFPVKLNFSVSPQNITLSITR